MAARIAPSALAPVASITGPTTLNEQIRVLAPLIQKTIGTTDPYDSFDSGSKVFANSFDWHSSVHAHWALLGMARVTKDAKLEQFALSRLTPAELGKERAFLKTRGGSDFELPYGQAWLLMLLAEMSTRPEQAKNPQLQGLRAETEERVVRWLEKHDFPDGWFNLEAEHDSWLVAYQLLQQSHPSPAVQKRLDVLKATKIEPNRARIEKQKQSHSNFVHLPAVLATIDRLSPTPTPHLYEPHKLPFPRDLDGSNNHQAGAALNHVWPWAIDASRGDTAAAAKVDQKLAEMFARPEVYSKDFELVGHWVPQFAWMAMALKGGLLP